MEQASRVIKRKLFNVLLRKSFWILGRLFFESLELYLSLFERLVLLPELHGFITLQTNENVNSFY